jgi:transposase
MGHVSVHQEVMLMTFESVYEQFQERSLNCEQAARILGISISTFRRKRRSYEEDGHEGLLDKRLGKASARRAPVDEVMRVEELYKTRYFDFTAKHFHEQLPRYGINRSYTWTKNILQRGGFIAKAKKRGAHRRKRPRKPLKGMMLHQDGSSHQWVPGKIWDLIVTLDDATNEIYSMFFVDEEGTNSSFRALHEVMSTHGRFCSLYTDRGSHYWVTTKAGDKVDKNSLTQVGRALAQLGIEHIPSYSPQARGRSERMFETLQGRLPQELRVRGITEMEAANQYIREEFLQKHNQQFMVPAEEEGSAFIPWAGIDLSDVLCIQTERTVTNDNTVSYKGMSLQIPVDKHRYHYVKVKVRVHEYPEGTMAVFYGPRCLGRYDKTGKALKEEGVGNAASRRGFSHAAAPKEGVEDEGRSNPAPSSVTAPSWRSGCSPAEPYPPDGTFGIG